MKIIVNGQFSDAHEFKAGIPQGSLLGPFLLYINDLYKNRSLVNIYADETTFYGSNTKNLEDQKPSAGLSSDLTRTVW